MVEVGDILRDYPHQVAVSWEMVQKALKKEKDAYSSALLRHKAILKSEGMAPSPAGEDAKHLAQLDEEYTKAYLYRVGIEAKHREQNDTQTNARRLAEMLKQGI